ncbi:MAG: hypothetical protein ACRD15_10150 [Vicinamibacterales bacterium]
MRFDTRTGSGRIETGSPAAHHPRGGLECGSDEFAKDVVMDATEYLRLRPDRRDMASREQLLGRVRAEFAEMPCLRLTRAQAQRLFGLRADICDRVLAALVNEGTIYQDPDQQFRAYDDAPMAAPKERVPE